MDTQNLTAFIAVADTGSFTQAAESLHLSQPAISKRVTVLEQQIGASLFDRIGRQITLTDAGRALLPYARRTLQDIEDARRALSQLANQVSGRLSIGTSHHIGLHRLPPVLRQFTERYPEVDLDLHFMDSEVACEAVLAGKLELGIVTLPLSPLPNLDTRAVWHDPLVIVVAPGHPLARVRRPQLSDLAAHPAVLPDEATYTHRIVKDALHRLGLEPRVRLATNYLETLKMLVGIGLGWSVLPLSMADATLNVIRIPGLKMERSLGTAQHRHRAVSRAAQALLDLLPTRS